MKCCNYTLLGRIAIIPLLLMVTSTHAGVYKCKDASGNTVFSDKPCGKEDKPEIVPIAPGPTDQQVKEARKVEQRIKASADEMEQQRKQREATAAQQREAAKRQEEKLVKPVERAPQVTVSPPKPVHPQQPVRPQRPVTLPANVGGAGVSNGGSGGSPVAAPQPATAQ